MKKLLDISNKELINLGVCDWGYIEGSTPDSLANYNQWLEKKRNEPLGYMGDERAEKRRDLKNFYPDFQSALVFLFPYTNERKTLLETNQQYQLASYVYAFNGKDYHYELSDRLNQIAEKLKVGDRDLEYQLSIDAQPVLERDLAYRAGLGWFGKNSMLINQGHGSYFFIASILLNKKLEIEFNSKEQDHCGTCTKCIDACPTDAIDSEARAIITEKCISTYTIELFKDEVEPPSGYGDQPFIFGCDICQDVCPWNSKPLDNATNVELNKKLTDISQNFSIAELTKLSKRAFRKMFQFSPIGRTGKEGFLKNITRKIQSEENS